MRLPFAFLKSPALTQLSPDTGYLFRFFRVANADFPSMLTRPEIDLCEELAQQWDGKGAIVDLGSFTGAATNAFCRGLTLVPDVHRPVHAFDFFSLQGFPGSAHALGDTFAKETLLDTFLRVNHPHLGMISVHAGDVMDAGWHGPISILFNDVCKSPEVNRHVLRTFFPHLAPGAMLVQQDYLNFNESWIVLTMEHLRDYFEFVSFIPGASAVFRCRETIPAEMLDFNAAELPDAQVADYFASAASRTTGHTADLINLTYAFHLHRRGDDAGARRVLLSVAQPSPEDPTMWAYMVRAILDMLGGLLHEVDVKAGLHVG